MTPEQNDAVQRLEAERLRPTPPAQRAPDTDAAANRARLEAALDRRRRKP